MRILRVRSKIKWVKEKSFDYGVGAELLVIPKKLTLKAQYDYTRSDGSVDFTCLPGRPNASRGKHKRLG